MTIEQLEEAAHPLHEANPDQSRFEIMVSKMTADFIEQAAVVLGLNWSRKRRLKWFRRWRGVLRREKPDARIPSFRSLLDYGYSAELPATNIGCSVA